MATALQLKESAVGSGSAGKGSATLAVASQADDRSARKSGGGSEVIKNLERQVRTLEEELLRKQAEISSFTLLNTKNSEGLSREDLVKLCEYLK